MLAASSLERFPVIVAVTQDNDLIARLGGDEFAVLVSEVDSEERVGKIAPKIVEALSAPYPDPDGHDVETSPSIGVALYPNDGKDIDTIARARTQRCISQSALAAAPIASSRIRSTHVPNAGWISSHACGARSGRTSSV
jgi:GGDEF domain-containing protein